MPSFLPGPPLRGPCLGRTVAFTSHVPVCNFSLSTCCSSKSPSSGAPRPPLHTAFCPPVLSPPSSKLLPPPPAPNRSFNSSGHLLSCLPQEPERSFASSDLTAAIPLRAFCSLLCSRVRLEHVCPSVCHPRLSPAGSHCRRQLPAGPPQVPPHGTENIFSCLPASSDRVGRSKRASRYLPFGEQDSKCSGRYRTGGPKNKTKSLHNYIGA